MQLCNHRTINRPPKNLRTLHNQISSDTVKQLGKGPLVALKIVDVTGNLISRVEVQCVEWCQSWEGFPRIEQRFPGIVAGG